MGNCSSFEVRIRELIDDMPDLTSMIESLLIVRKKMRNTNVHGS